MKAEDIIGSWVSSKTIQEDGSVKNSGLVKGKLQFNADGTAKVSVAFMKFKAKWEINGDELSLDNVSSGESVGTLTFADGELTMHPKSQNIQTVYVRA